MNRFHRSLLGKFPGLSNLVEGSQRRGKYLVLVEDLGKRQASTLQISAGVSGGRRMSGNDNMGWRPLWPEDL